LEANFQNEHRVHFYAQEQCVTSKYLSMVVKNVTGTTAGAWIDKIIVFEAQRQLKYTNKSIQQIASDLKFTNQSTFGKHFKKKTNYTPSEYRERDLYY
jgi:AraC family transcriptional activator of pobA